MPNRFKKIPVKHYKKVQIRHIKQRVFNLKSFLTGVILGSIVITLAFGTRRYVFPSQLEFIEDRPDLVIQNYTPPGAIPSEPFPPSPPSPAISQKIPHEENVRVPILMYHYVEYNKDPKDTMRTSLSVTPYWFEKQLQYLRDHNYTTVTLSDLKNAVEGKGGLPERPVILTFDDGYRDFYTDAWPILKKYHMKATIYIIADFLDKPNYMYSDQLRTIVNDPEQLVSIGAHTMRHPNLALVDSKIAKEEINQSKKVLEEKYGLSVTTFAYPYGAFKEETKELVKEAGYDLAVSTIYGDKHHNKNLFILPRIRIGNYDGALFGARLGGR